MTATPGPQQPDEVCIGCGHGGLVHGKNGCRICPRQRRCYNFRPGAPSAQPDDRHAQLRGAIEMWASDFAPQIADHILTRFPDLDLGTPAQPVRDTGEGRR